MVCDLQKANMWKRISAWLFDTILLGILVVAVGCLLSAALNYDGYHGTLDAAYEKYETQYGISFSITQEDYAAMPAEGKAQYDAAYDALIADDEALYAYNMVINLTLLISTFAILLAFIGLEFIVPLLFGNGQTLGKKIFGVGLMRTDGVQINTMMLFLRTVLGKFTIETMVPVLILIMLYFNIVSLTGTLIILALLLIQVFLLIFHRGNAQIHDLLAGTVAVDIASQRIFRSEQELLDYKKRIAAEAAARQVY